MILRPEVIQVLKRLDHYNIPFVIAGGYPRDIALGNKPNDIDIFILHKKSTHTEVFLLYMEDAYHKCSCHEYDDTDFNSYKYDVKGTQINIIVDHVSDSVIDVINDFDFNINQFVLTSSRYYESFCVQYLGGSFGKLQVVSKGSVTEERMSRFKQMAKDTGWLVD